MSLLNLRGRVSREPTLRDKLFHRVLLLKIQSEQFSSDGLERVWISTRLKLPLHPLQLEESPSGHSHNGSIREEQDVEEKSTVFLTFDFYPAFEIPGVLAIVRFTIPDSHDHPGVDVTEVVYPNSPDGYCRLEEDVPSALAHGVNVLMLSHMDTGDLPEINALLNSTTEV